MSVVADPCYTEKVCAALAGADLMQRIATLEAALAYHMAVLPVAERELMLACRNDRTRRALALILTPPAGIG